MPFSLRCWPFAGVLTLLLLACAPARAQVALGQAHSCALMTDRTVRCWGSNASGQAGAGARGAVGDEDGEVMGLEPVPLGGSVAQIAAGGYHTCAVRTDGGLRCWGDGRDGALGLGDALARGDEPGEVEALPDVPLGASVQQVAAGLRHTCALTAAGGVRCWGSGAYGQTGSGADQTLGDEPGEVEALADLPLGRPATAVAAGAYHTCALLDDASVRCWGLGVFGQTGAGSTDVLGDEPGEVEALDALPLPPVRALAAGFGHTCALLEAGSVACWGDGFFGQLGSGSTQPLGDEPGELSALEPLAFASPVAEIAAGRDHTCARLTGGAVTCWGDAAFGQIGSGAQDRLGDEPAERADRLAALDLPRPAQVIAAGATHTCAVLDGGELRCWGSGAQGRLGLGDTRTWGDQPGEMDDLPAVPLSADVLPVELSAFEAVALGMRTRLSWATASETANAGWSVEHAAPAPAADGLLPTPELWRPLAWIDGAGTTSQPRAYAFTTPDLAPGTHRFRLRQRDLDGAETLSRVVEVAIGVEGGYRLAAPAPNPARQAASATLHVAADQHVRATLVDLLGRTVAVVWDSEVRAGRPQRLDVDAARLAAGAYLLRVEGERFRASAPLRIVR